MGSYLFKDANSSEKNGTEKESIPFRKASVHDKTKDYRKGKTQKCKKALWSHIVTKKVL